MNQFCRTCQAPVDPKDQYCGVCGAQLPVALLTPTIPTVNALPPTIPAVPLSFRNSSLWRKGRIGLALFMCALFIILLASYAGRDANTKNTVIPTPTAIVVNGSGITATVPVGLTPTVAPTTDSMTPTPTQTVPSPTPTIQTTLPPSPTAVSVHPGQILYTADFRNRASDWTFDDQWFVSDGMLIGKGTSMALLNVPIPTINYTVKASIRFTYIGDDFEVVARYQSMTQGDAVSLAWVTNTYVGLSTCPTDSCAGSTSAQIGFLPTNKTINLQITCQDVHITVIGMGHILKGDDTSNVPAAGNVVILNHNMGVEILSLQVIAA